MNGVVYVDDGLAGLANQLWAMASAVAYGLETGVPISAPCFYRHIHRFPRLTEAMHCPTFMLRWGEHHLHAKLYRLVTHAVRAACKPLVLEAMTKVHLPPSEPWVGQDRRWADVGKDRIALVYGWMVRNPQGLLRHHQRIRELFSPGTAVATRATRCLETLRTRGVRVFGVHWRRGDYRSWQGGRFLISEEEVAGHMRSATTHARRQGLTARFFVATDEPMPAALSRIFPISTGEISDPLDDLTVLAGCDEILGSHSSFGRWAAYAGDIPFRVLVPGRTIDWESHETLRDLVGPRNADDRECHGWLSGIEKV